MSVIFNLLIVTLLLVAKPFDFADTCTRVNHALIQAREFLAIVIVSILSDGSKLEVVRPIFPLNISIRRAMRWSLRDAEQFRECMRIPSILPSDCENIMAIQLGITFVLWLLTLVLDWFTIVYHIAADDGN